MDMQMVLSTTTFLNGWQDFGKANKLNRGEAHQCYALQKQTKHNGEEEGVKNMWVMGRIVVKENHGVGACLQKMKDVKVVEHLEV